MDMRRCPPAVQPTHSLLLSSVALFKTVEPQVSAYYLDAETNKLDSERAAANLLKTIFTKEIEALEVGEKGLTQEQRVAVGEKLLVAVNKSAADFGLMFEAVEVRKYNTGRGQDICGIVTFFGGCDLDDQAIPFDCFARVTFQHVNLISSDLALHSTLLVKLHKNLTIYRWCL